MDTYYCRGIVSVFDPDTRHSYNEQEVNRYVEAPTAEEAMEIFRSYAERNRHPISPALVLVKFKDVNQRFDRRDIGVIPYQKRKK